MGDKILEAEGKTEMEVRGVLSRSPVTCRGRGMEDRGKEGGRNGRGVF